MSTSASPSDPSPTEPRPARGVLVCSEDPQVRELVCRLLGLSDGVEVLERATPQSVGRLEAQRRFVVALDVAQYESQFAGQSLEELALVWIPRPAGTSADAWTRHFVDGALQPLVVAQEQLAAAPADVVARVARFAGFELEPSPSAASDAFAAALVDLPVRSVISQGIRRRGAARAGRGNERHDEPALLDETERRRRELANRALLEEELLGGALEFRSRPYEANVQFSTICNMSCVMCHDGNNPPARRMSAQLLERLSDELGPQLSVVTPHDGSEPLIASWEETRRLAKRQRIKIELTTNVQFLDEAAFTDVADVLESLTLSIDSHLPEVYEKIRPGSRPARVFENLPLVLRLARERKVEAIVAMVLLTENCASLPESIAAFARMGAETVSINKLVDYNQRSQFHNALRHFSPEYIEWIRVQCVEAARRHAVRLIWGVGGFQTDDFRVDPVRVDARKAWNDEWNYRLARYVPGFCRFVSQRLRVNVDGDVAPCPYSGVRARELHYGNLTEQSFEELWNGARARDLRRAMRCGDLPRLCSTCAWAEPPAPAPRLVFSEKLDRTFPGVVAELEPLAPEHAERWIEAPLLRVSRPDFEPRRFEVALSLGGELRQVERFEAQPLPSHGDSIELEIPREVWERLVPNLGYWWSVWAIGEERTVRVRELRCLIRHADLPRIPDSGLDYPDQATVWSRDLGWQRKRRAAIHRPAAARAADAEPELPAAPREERTPMNPTLPQTKVDPAAARRTGEWMSRARKVLAYGGFDGVVQRPLYHGDDGVFPQFAVAAQGCELVDSCGQRYVDWTNGWGPVMLGYREPRVEAAIREQLAAGPTLSLMHPLEIEVAELIVELVPCAEMVAFGKNGSDVLNAAVRVARAATGRELVLQCGFHGFHEWYTCLHPEVRGIPAVFRELVRSFPYNDLAALEQLLASNSGRVAAIVMEPTARFLPAPGYLEGVRALASRHGCLLVFDEVITGFRVARGGAQELFGVVPDLACFSKGLANGMPISAIVGKREYMQFLPSTGFGMTFRGETLSLAAARATLRIVRDEPVCETLTRTGERLRAGFERLCAERGIPGKLEGHPTRMSYAFAGAGGLSWDDVRKLFLQQCLIHGVMTGGMMTASYAIDDAALERTLSALERALDVVAEAIRIGRVDDPRPSGGSPFGPRAIVSSGFIDQLALRPDGLAVGGWMLLDDGAPERFDVVSTGGEVVAAQPIARPDIAKAFPGKRDGEKSGYWALLQPASFAVQGEYEFDLRAWRGERVVFRCHVVRSAEATLSGPFWTGDGVLYV